MVPSLYEGFSLPTVEAMACGTPVVASDAGALPEVVGTGSEAGLLVPPGDVEALVTTVGALLNDPHMRETMGRAARERAMESFSWTAVARATVEAYESAIATHHASNQRGSRRAHR